MNRYKELTPRYKTFTAFVKDSSGKHKYITLEYKTKTAFIKDLRANGYKVNNYKVKLKIVYDYILEKTNTEKEDFKYINTVIDTIKHSENRHKFFTKKMGG